MIHQTLIFTGLAFIGMTLNAAAEKSSTNTTTLNPYNEQLANQLGADQYGMKMYVMAF